MTEKLEPTDFVTVKPLSKAEFVIQVMRIAELNEAWEGKPAMVFVIDPRNPSKEGAIEVSADEYARLKFVLTGDMAVPPEELKKAYTMAIENDTAGNEPDAVEPKIKPKKRATKK